MAAITEFFPDYQAALATCGDGYQAEDIAAVVAYRTAHLAAGLPGSCLSPDYWVMLVKALTLARAGGTRMRVLDFGGGCGLHYHLVRAILPDLTLHWSVVETPATVAAARALPRMDGLDFFPSVEQAQAALGGCDLVHASGALPYVPAPEATLAALAGRSRFLVLARFPAHDGPRCVGVQQSLLSQHCPGPMPPGLPDRPVRYPITFLPMADVLRLLAPHYRALEQVPSDTVYELDGTKVPGASFLFRA